MSTDELYWKVKHDQLQTRVQALAEDLEYDVEDQPDVCISTSEEFYVSNDLSVCDSLDYALAHWGEGKFFRVTRQNQDDLERDIREHEKNENPK